MNIEIFEQGYQIQKDISLLNQLKEETKKNFERVFPNSISYGDETPPHWEFTQQFRNATVKKFNEQIDKKIADLENKFQKL